MKTAPFDLELAKVGHPLVTRDGHKVLDFKYFNFYTGSHPIRCLTLEDSSTTYHYTPWGGARVGQSHATDLFLDLETPWEKPLQQGEEILCYNPSTNKWVPLIFMCMEGKAVVAKGTNTVFYMSFDTWKRPEPVKQETTKFDITLDVKINGKDMSKEDKTKFMDYLKKFLNEVL